MMRFLVDAQLPPALARFLEAHGHESKAARETGLREADDTAIWTFAQVGGWVVVTKDEDFAERSLRSVIGPQVLWLRIGNSTNRVLFAWLEPLLPAAVQDLQSGHRLVELQRQSPYGART
jgi:predicted nuclease of predicted toxin-antitoxin system